MAGQDLGGNQPVVAYLNHYCKIGAKFDFAVMLSGPWGFGKSTFIKKYIASKENDGDFPKFILISLYGITKTSQIDDELYSQLHPFLSSKKVKFATQLLRGAAHAALKFDLAGGDHVPVELQIPRFDLREYISNPTDRIIVFDDLERCSMQISDLLGYLNSFVEHQEIKIIIIANEGELIERERTNAMGENLRYKRIKEKLIGRTLEVRLDVDNLVPEFTANVKNDRAKKLFDSGMEAVITIFKQSGTNNLRILKQALWDFDYLSDSFMDEHWSHIDVMAQIMRVVLALSFEVRAGRLEREDIDKVSINRIARALGKKNDIGRIANELEARYPEAAFDQPYVSTSTLTKLFFDGRIDGDEIRSSLNANAPFSPLGKESPWRQVVRLLDVTDEEYHKSVSAMEQEFSERQVSVPGEVLHVFALRLFLAAIGILDKSRDVIVEECKKYVDDLVELDKIPDINVDGDDDLALFGGYGGYSFADAGSQEFAQLRKYYDDAKRGVAIKKLPIHAEELMKLMKADTASFFRKICINNVESSPYYDVPVLASLLPQYFVDSVLQLAPGSQRTVFTALKSRYERDHIEFKLTQEWTWLKEVRALFVGMYDKLQPLSRYRLKSSVELNIDPTLSLFQQSPGPG